MGGESAEMSMILEVQAPLEQQSNIDEMVSFLEEIWEQEESIRETHSDAEWQEFIDSVKNPEL